MKNIIFSNRTLMLMLLLGLFSCKKYGYKFEDGFNKPSTATDESALDTAMSKVDRSLYSRARIFPGMVDAAEPRVKDAKFTLDLNFSKSDRFTLRISVAPLPQFSTGYYAPAGELIKLVVPSGVNGLSVLVGGHTDNLTGQVNLKRDPVIYTVKQLYPGENFVRNGYGGTIYIIGSFAIPQPVEFTITGAVKAPDFVLGKSNNAAWIAEVKASTVPWLEMRSNRVIFLIPRDFLIRNFNSSKPLTDPTALMTAWNDVFEKDFNAWMGLSDGAEDERDRSPQGPWREVLDIQPSVGYGHNGFPVVATMDNEWFNSVISIEQLLHGDNWGTYHEFGHNCQQGNIWSWSTLGETTNNLFSYKVANRNGTDFKLLHGDWQNWTTPSLAYAAKEPVDATGKRKDFNTDAEIASPADSHPFKRIIPFLQLFWKYGYDVMPYLYTNARHAQRYSTNDQDMQDFVYENVSTYAKVDLMPFFDYWGIRVSPQSGKKIGKLYPLLDKNIWTYNPMTKVGGTTAYTPLRMTASSEELTGEGTTNGRAAALVDGNNATYWHSRWASAPVGTMPYQLVLDIGAYQVVKGMYFIPRASAGQVPKDVEIFKSDTNNGSDWESIGTFQIGSAAGVKNNYIFPQEVQSRYFRITIKNNWPGNANASLAEVNIIKP
jgi:hypothetical protein